MDWMGKTIYAGKPMGFLPCFYHEISGVPWFSCFWWSLLEPIPEENVAVHDDLGNSGHDWCPVAHRVRSRLRIVSKLGYQVLISIHPRIGGRSLRQWRIVLTSSTVRGSWTPALLATPGVPMLMESLGLRFLYGFRWSMQKTSLFYPLVNHHVDAENRYWSWYMILLLIGPHQIEIEQHGFRTKEWWAFVSMDGIRIMVKSKDGKVQPIQRKVWNDFRPHFWMHFSYTSQASNELDIAIFIAGVSGNALADHPPRSLRQRLLQQITSWSLAIDR